MQPLEAEGQGDLALKEGQAVRVTHDPEGEMGCSQDRWVYGCTEGTGQCGWFCVGPTYMNR